MKERCPWCHQRVKPSSPRSVSTYINGALRWLHIACFNARERRITGEGGK